jgi:signal transduction histidine kinase
MAYTAREIGTSAQSWVTVQDGNDVLYFGCDGVVSFDGERWRQYKVPGSYAVRGLAFGPSGRLWVGAFNEVGYFDRTEKGLSDYHSLIGFLPEREREVHDVWDAFALGEGAVFITNDSVLVWDGAGFKTYPLPGARRLGAFQMDGTIYVAHPPTGAWTVGKDGLKNFMPGEALDHAALVWMEKGPTHSLLATTNGFFTDTGGKLAEFGEGLSEFVRKNTLTSVCRLANEDLCIGTLIGGIAIAGPNGKIKRIIGPEDGLLSRSVYSLYSAHDGSLWATSTVGITRILAGAGVSFFDARRGLTGKPSYSVTQSGTDILVANPEGVFDLKTGDNGSNRFDVIQGLPGRYTDLLTFPADTVYASGFKRIDRLNDGQVSLVFSTNTDVFRMRQSSHPSGTFLAACGYEILRLHSQNGVQLRSTTVAHVPDLPTSLVEAPNGDVWLGTQSKGAFAIPYLQDSQASPVQVDDYDRAKDSTQVMVARVGEKVGVFSKKGTRLYSAPGGEATSLDVVPRSDALAISNPDPSGALWIAFGSPFSDGIQVPVLGRLSIDPKGTASWKPYAVQGLSQLGEITSLFVDDRGVVWLGGSEGLLRIEAESVGLVGTPRAPLLQASVEQDQRVAASDNMVDFDFSAVEFGRRSSFRFQTRLSGGNYAWSAPINDNHLRLAGLQSGHYEFAVRTINDAGVAGPVSVVRFTVLPPWYKTLPALLLFVLLLVAGFYGALQWRLAYLRRQNIRLETLVKKKTEQLEKANEAKSEFLANMSHEIRNPISGILGLSMAFDETQMDSRQKHLANSISSCANLLATLVDDVLDFSKIEAGKIELRSAPFSVRNLLEQCVAMVERGGQGKGKRYHDIGRRAPARAVRGGLGPSPADRPQLPYERAQVRRGKADRGRGPPGFHDRVPASSCATRDPG